MTGVQTCALPIYEISFEDFEMGELGKEIRFHKMFAPNGTNIDSVQQLNHNTIALRTYERGVEGETLACGTGSVASALVSSLKWNLKSPINVIPKSKQQLKIHFEKGEKHFKNIWLEGPAKIIFNGIVSYDTETNAILEPHFELEESIKI